MWIAVISACNEARSITQVIESVFKAGVDLVVLVANGCTDQTASFARQKTSEKNLILLNFHQRLGIDIPRAVGAAFIKKLNLRGVLFVDGDMSGQIDKNLTNLISYIEDGYDVALTNCYPHITYRSGLSRAVLQSRELLNRKLGLFDTIGLATPSHGPHALSRRFLELSDPRLLAIPPLILAFAVKNALRIGVATEIAHHLLGSSPRDEGHGTLVAETIIGDCRQAISYFQGTTLQQLITHREPPYGYWYDRRFDLLENFLSQE